MPHFKIIGSHGARPSERDTPGFQSDAVARNGMFYGAKWSNPGWFNTENSFEDLFHVSFAICAFHIWEFP